MHAKCVTYFPPSDKAMWHFTKMDNRKMELANKWRCSQETKRKIKPKVKRESGCNGKDENVTEEMTCSKTLTLKELRKISQYWKCKGADPYLERSMIICQGIEMMLVSYHMLLICWEAVVIFKDLEEAPNVYPCLPLQSRCLSRAY